MQSRSLALAFLLLSAAVAVVAVPAANASNIFCVAGVQGGCVQEPVCVTEGNKPSTAPGVETGPYIIVWFPDPMGHSNIYVWLYGYC